MITTSTQKACLFNLIVYTEEDIQLVHLQEIVETILNKFPARVISVLGEPNNSESKINKQEAEPQSSIPSWNQICLKIPAPMLPEIETAILPYLIPDYPVFLIFSGNLNRDNPLFNTLVKTASRLIIDSEHLEHLPNFSQQVLQVIDKSRIDVYDICWAKTTGWRTLLSEIFDTEENLSALFNAKEIFINFSQSANQALYLQYWLAARLGWIFKSQNKSSEKEILLTYQFQGKEIRVCLQKSPSDHLSEGCITEFILQDLDQRSIKILKKEDSPQVNVQISTPQTCDMPQALHLPNFHRGSSYLYQLLYSRTSEQYIQMLNLLANQKDFS